MSARILDDIAWYVDKCAQKRGEPGIVHSFMKCLATAVNYISGGLDPIWLMGSSTFAFRIVVNENLCPSAMSVFDWSLLPEKVEQAGRKCTYISRLWDDRDREVERRNEAHDEILRAIDRGVPAIVWDIEDVEWGLIVG